MAETVITIESLMGGRQVVLAIDPTSLLTADTARTNGVHPCMYPQVHPEAIIEIATALRDSGALIFTPTSLSNPLNVKFALGLEEDAFHLNLKAARLTREAVGEGILIGGLMSASFFEQICLAGKLSRTHFICSFVEQAQALRAGGSSYYFIHGFSNRPLIEEVIKGIGLSEKKRHENPLQIVVTLPIQNAHEVPLLIQNIRESGRRVLAAGVTLSFSELLESLDEIRKLKEQMGDTPLMVMLENGYRFSDNGIVRAKIVSALDAFQIQSTIQTLKACGVSIAGFTQGVSLELIQALAVHESQVLLPEAG